MWTTPLITSLVCVAMVLAAIILRFIPLNWLFLAWGAYAHNMFSVSPLKVHSIVFLFGQLYVTYLLQWMGLSIQEFLSPKIVLQESLCFCCFLWLRSTYIYLFFFLSFPPSLSLLTLVQTTGMKKFIKKGKMEMLWESSFFIPSFISLWACGKLFRTVSPQ